MKRRSRKKDSFFHKHSLSIVAISLLLLWVGLYSKSNPDTHWGSFFGNAIADWSGSVVIILGTKFLVEVGSAESKPMKKHWASPIINFLWKHSLLIFLLVTGLGWLFIYVRIDPTSKWGQVTGNIISEWVQMMGLVFLTKSLIESGSKE